MLSHTGALRGWRSILTHYVSQNTTIIVFMNRTNAARPDALFPRSVTNEIVTAQGIARMRLAEQMKP